MPLPVNRTRQLESLKKRINWRRRYDQYVRRVSINDLATFKYINEESCEFPLHSYNAKGRHRMHKEEPSTYTSQMLFPSIYLSLFHFFTYLGEKGREVSEGLVAPWETLRKCERMRDRATGEGEWRAIQRAREGQRGRVGER
jgi:hypothetical protein